MRRYLMISPSFNQDSKERAVDSVRKFVNNPNLGANARGSVWDKRYKLRLTSKLTGKKVDINFSSSTNKKNELMEIIFIMKVV